MIMHIATLLIVAFFIFFAAQKAEGFVSLFGYVLGALVVLGAVFHIAGLLVPGMAMKMGMHEDGMHGHWMHHDDMQPAMPMQPAVAPAPAKPAQPAPAAPKKS
jgi:hypothetical protein